MELNQIIHGDCMGIMRDIPDKYFELAIVDPPYGVGETWKKSRKGTNKETKTYKNSSIPDKKYFEELFRISKNWIIWGANYYLALWPSKNVIIWDKICTWEKDRKSEIEIAITSLSHRPSSIYRHQWSGGRKGNETGISTIHPHQKPIGLYRWLLNKYAKHGDKIIDTHSGSGSCAIACFLEHHDFLAIEKDADYHAASVNRYNEIISQGRLFE